MITQNFNLKWDEFEKSASHAFKELLDHQDFTDVTLVTEDDKEAKCHKVVLGKSSPVLRSILIRNPHQHPLLYLSGVQHSDLEALLSFMYLGQAEVAQDNLDTFMALASKLQIKGLSTSKENHKEEKDDLYLNNEKQEPELQIEEKDDYCENVIENELPPLFEERKVFSAQHHGFSSEPNRDHVKLFPYSEGVDLQAKPGNEEKIERCDKCAYTSKSSGNVKMHMKAQHEGRRYSCGSCEYTSGYSTNLKKHRIKKHCF